MLQLLWNSSAAPQEVQHGITISPSNAIFGIYPKERRAGTQTDICMPTFIAALFTIAKKVETTHVPKDNE